jgi:hypothetical protein
VHIRPPVPIRARDYGQLVQDLAEIVATRGSALSRSRRQECVPMSKRSRLSSADQQQMLAEATADARQIELQPALAKALAVVPSHLAAQLVAVVLHGAKPDAKLIQAGRVFGQLGHMLELVGVEPPKRAKPRGSDAPPPEDLPAAAWRNPLSGKLIACPPWGGGMSGWPRCGAKTRSGGKCGIPVAPGGNGRCRMHGMWAGQRKVAPVRSPRHARQLQRRLKYEAWLRAGRPEREREAVEPERIPPVDGW